MRRLTLAVVGILLSTRLPAAALSRGRQCVQSCGALIAQCGTTCGVFGDLSKSCKRAVLKRCKQEGLSVCGVTSTTTPPGSTTSTTIAPLANGVYDDASAPLSSGPTSSCEFTLTIAGSGSSRTVTDWRLCFTIVAGTSGTVTIASDQVAFSLDGCGTTYTGTGTIQPSGDIAASLSGPTCSVSGPLAWTTTLHLQ